MCLTIDKPFFTAFLCGKCLDNVHGRASYDRCLEIGGKQMTAREPYGGSLEPHVLLNHVRPSHPGLEAHAGTSTS